MRLFLIAALTVAAVRPAAADTFLYATASTIRRLDGFRVAPDGSLDPSPIVQVGTRGLLPRRLLKNGCTLYVAENDRVEVFRAQPNGQLTLIGSTKKTPDHTGDYDIALAEDGRTLYVPSRVQAVVKAYPLGDDGTPNFDPVLENPDDTFTSGQPRTCVYAAPSPQYEDLWAANGKLYVTEFDRVSAYGVDAEGGIFGTVRVDRDKNHDGTIEKDEEDICPYYDTTPVAPEACPDDTQPNAARPSETCPLSRRNHIQGPLGLVVNGLTLVVAPRFTLNLIAFALASDGNFPPFGEDPANPTSKEKKQERKSRKPNQTDSDVRYVGLTYYTPPGSDKAFIFASSGKGFTEQFGIPSTGKRLLPKNPYSKTKKDVASTPVRNTVRPAADGSRAILYVGTGERDNVRAYALRDNGTLPFDATPMSETDDLVGSYPNDVVLIDTTTCD